MIFEKYHGACALVGSVFLSPATGKPFEMATELQPVHGAVAEFCKSKDQIVRRKELSRETTEALLLRSRELKDNLLRDMVETGVAIVDVAADDGTRWYVRTELSGALPMTERNMLDALASITCDDFDDNDNGTPVEELWVAATKAAWKRRAQAFKVAANKKRIILTRSKARRVETAKAAPSLCEKAASFVYAETKLKQERAAVRRDIAMPMSVCKQTESGVMEDVRAKNPESLVQHVHMRTRDVETIYTMQCCPKKVRPRFTLKVYMQLVRDACRECGAATETSFLHDRDMPRVTVAFERVLQRFMREEPHAEQTVRFHVVRKG